MTGFEERGVQLQMACETEAQAMRTFNHSCRLCAEKGLRIRCDRCAIAVANEQVCDAIRSCAEYRRQEAIKRNQLKKALVQGGFC